MADYVCTPNDHKNLSKRMRRTNEAMKVKYHYFDLVVLENQTWCQVFSHWYHKMRAAEKNLNSGAEFLVNK
jgi:hypothetical protein